MSSANLKLWPASSDYFINNYQVHTLTPVECLNSSSTNESFTTILCMHYLAIYVNNPFSVTCFNVVRLHELIHVINLTCYLTAIKFHFLETIRSFVLDAVINPIYIGIVKLPHCFCSSLLFSCIFAPVKVI